MSFNSETIQVFLTVLDRGSFSAAARSLQRVPSAISMAIGNLEAELGYDLFQRGPREVRPTAQALALEPHARLIAEQLGLLQVHAVELSHGLESNLTLAVVPDVDQRPLIAAIAEVGERYPLLEIAILSAPQEQALGLLDSGRADLCVAFAGLQVDPQRGFQLMGVDPRSPSPGRTAWCNPEPRRPYSRAADPGTQPRPAIERSAHGHWCHALDD